MQVAIENMSSLVEREAMFLQSLRRGGAAAGGEMPGPMKGIDMLKQQVSQLLDPIATVPGADVQLVCCLRSTVSDLQASWTLYGSINTSAQSPPAANFHGAGLLTQECTIPQMHQCVLIPLIKWALLGYAEFIPLEDFVQYRPLVPELHNRNLGLRELCEAICAAAMVPDLYQVGDTMVVLKKGQTVNLDQHLEACDMDAAVRIQTWWRQKQGAAQVEEKRSTVVPPAIKIQAQWRTKQQRRKYQEALFREKTAAKRIQGFWREKSTEARNELEGEAAETIQRAFRGKVGRDTAESRQKAVDTIHRARKGSQMRNQVHALKASLEKSVTLIQRAVRAMLAKKKTWRVLEEAEAACIIQEAYLNHYCRRWEAASKVQKWWRAKLADLAIHWVLKQLRRSVFVAQFAYSSLKAKEIAKQYSKYEGAAESIQKVWRGKQQAGGVDNNVLKVLDEQLNSAVDAAARNKDMQELQRVLDFATEEGMEDLVLKIQDLQVRSCPKVDHGPKVDAGGSGTEEAVRAWQ